MASAALSDFFLPIQNLPLDRFSSETIDLFGSCKETDSGIESEVDSCWIVSLHSSLQRQLESDFLLPEFGGLASARKRARKRGENRRRTHGKVRREYVFYYSAISAMRAVERIKGEEKERQRVLSEALCFARTLFGAVGSLRPHALEAAAACGVVVGATLGYVRSFPNAQEYFETKAEEHSFIFAVVGKPAPRFVEHEKWLHRLHDILSPTFRTSVAGRSRKESAIWQRILLQLPESGADERAWDELLLLLKMAATGGGAKRPESHRELSSQCELAG